MFNYSEWRRKRFAEHPELREKMLAVARAYRQEHKQELKERHAHRMRTDPEYRDKKIAIGRRSALKRMCARFGMSLADFDRMLEQQNGVCALCKKKPRRRLCIDHCHATGKVRRLLCDNCNFMLGNAGDNPDVLYAGGDYIIEFRDPPAPSPHALAFWAVSMPQPRVRAKPARGRPALNTPRRSPRSTSRPARRRRRG